jgi:hypothetical protein
MLRDAEFFEDRELELVYIAKHLRDALRLEKALTGSGIDYAVETETYVGGIIFRTERVGAFFYVDPASAEPARNVVSSVGMQPHVEP